MKAMAPKCVLVSLLTVVSISSIIGSDSNGVEDNNRLAAVDGNDWSDYQDFGMRIVGGEQAEIGDYPYFVQMDGCGGALVAPDVVLFAAHCGSFLNKQVNVGAYKSWDPKGGAQGRFCQEWIGHPKYTASPPNYDFALCKLDRPIENFNTGRVRLELNFNDNLPSHGQDLLTMGFGLLTSGGITPEYLQDVKVDSIRNSDCNSAYRGRITDAMLCAGIQNQGGKDACQGDSGGPIVWRRVSDGSIVDTHVGIVSWGIGCGSARYPGVYARTSHQANWIQNTICGSLKSVASYCNNPAPTCGDKGDVTIKVKTDQYPEETSWTIKDASNHRIIQERRHFKMKNYQTESNLCLDTNACYILEINDTFGDGVCSSPYSCGSYSVMLNGKIVVTGNPRFGKLQTHVICVNSPSVNEEAKTTEAPTAKPTKAPTNVPTKNPTRSPNVCKDKASFRFQNKPNLNCKNWIKGKRKTILKRCRKKWKRYSVKNYWCRKRCAEMLGGKAKCFPLKDKKVPRRKKTQRGNGESIVGENNSGDNIFKRSNKSKTG